MLCHLNWDSQEAIFLLESWVQSIVDMIRPSSSVFRTECESSRTLLVRTQTLSRTSSGWLVPTEVRGSFILQLFTVIKINIENQMCIFPVDGRYFNQNRQNLFIRNHNIISSIHPQTTEVCFPIYLFLGVFICDVWFFLQAIFQRFLQWVPSEPVFRWDMSSTSQCHTQLFSVLKVIIKAYSLE